MKKGQFYVEKAHVLQLTGIISLSSAHNIWFTIFFFFSGVKLVYIKQQMRTMSRLEFIAIRTVFRPRHILPLPFRFSVSKTSFPPYNPRLRPRATIDSHEVRSSFHDSFFIFSHAGRKYASSYFVVFGRYTILFLPSFRYILRLGSNLKRERGEGGGRTTRAYLEKLSRSLSLDLRDSRFTVPYESVSGICGSRVSLSTQWFPWSIALSLRD